MAGRYWNATDTQGHCSRCGLPWTPDELEGNDRHECPPGFWKDLKLKGNSIPYRENLMKRLRESPVECAAYLYEAAHSTGMIS